MQVAWGFTEDGERILLALSLRMRESLEDWQTFGRDLISRGLETPMLIVADGAPGLIKAIEQCWLASDRQRCCVHRARNLYAKLPDRERERVKHAYWQALDDAISEADAQRRLNALVDKLDKGGFTAAARCLADDLDALVVHLRYPVRHGRPWRSTDENVKRATPISRSRGACGGARMAARGVARRQGCRRNRSGGSAGATGPGSERVGSSPLRGGVRPEGLSSALGFGQGVVDPGAKRRFWD